MMIVLIIEHYFAGHSIAINIRSLYLAISSVRLNDQKCSLTIREA